MNEIQEGRGEQAEAEAIYREVIGSPHSSTELLWEAHDALASLLVTAGRPTEAEAEFRKALSIMERSRAQLSRAAHKISFFSSLTRSTTISAPPVIRVSSVLSFIIFTSVFNIMKVLYTIILILSIGILIILIILCCTAFEYDRIASCLISVEIK